MKNNTWKTKIDPAFDELIQVYRLFLEECRLPANTGYICLADDCMRIMEQEGYPSLTGDSAPYEENAAAIVELGADEDVLLISTVISQFKGKKSLSEIISVMHHPRQMADGLSKKSKEYYLKRFAPLSSEEEANAYFMDKTEDERMTWSKDLPSDFGALFAHVSFKGILASRHNEQCELKDLNINKLSFTKTALTNIYSTISELTHSTALQNLRLLAASGDDAALFKAVQIDKTLVDEEWVRIRIRKAQYSGDREFFEQLGEAIKKTPLENDMEYGELLLILRFFWNKGLYRLTYPELRDLIEAGGIRLQEDPGTFKRYIYRLKKDGVLTSPLG